MNSNWWKLSSIALAFTAVHCSGSDAVSMGSGGSATTSGTGGSVEAGSGSGGSVGTGGGNVGGNASGGAPGSGGAAGGSAGAAGTSEAGVGDSATDAPTCPASMPTGGDTCTGADTCFYTDGVCRCRASNNARQWICATMPEASSNANCPIDAPAPGSSCAETGGGTICRYSTDAGRTMRCFCTNMAGDTWACN